MNNNNLYLTDKLAIIALRNLIPQQAARPITLAHIAAFAGISPRTVSTVLQRLRQRRILITNRARVGLPYTYQLENVPSFDENLLSALQEH